MRAVNSVPMLVVAGLLIIFLLGCGGAGSPTSPMVENPQLSGSSGGQAHSNQYIWGLYDITVDPGSGAVDIVPVRGAMFEANVTKFLHPPLAPINLLTLAVQPETNFPSGYVVLNVGIKHPFPATNLRGFDVMGIFMPPQGSGHSAWDPALTWPAIGDANVAQLLNPDGYTRWWNMVEFTSYDTIFGYNEGAMAVPGFESTSTLNAFKYFADGFDPETEFITENLMLSDRGSFDTVNPGIVVRRYEIQFPVTGPTPDWRFKYAISASYWGPDGMYTPPAPTEDFPLSANRAEAVLIEVEDGGSTAFYVNESTYGGDIVIDLKITDWQGMNSMQGPIPEISGIYAESPTLFDGVVNLLDTGGFAYEPPGPTTDVVGCTIHDVTPTGTTGQYLYIIVTSAEPVDYSVQLPDVTGFDYPEDAVLAAFTLWEAQVANIGPQENLPPVADASQSEPTEGPSPLHVNLDPSASYDADGVIVLYEWDIANDGSYEYSSVMPDIVEHTFIETGFHEVQLRVTDDDDAVDMLDEPLIIEVTDDDPCAKGPNFLACGDGNIFVDSYVDDADNSILFTNIINFDYGGPNSYNTIVKYYTGHGGTHNNSPITGDIKDLIEASGFMLVDTDEEPIDVNGCRIIFVCLPGANGGAAPFTQDEYDGLVQFLDDGGRLVLTQEYSDGPAQRQIGNDFLDGIGSSLERLSTTTGNQLTSVPNECYAITNGVSQTFNPAYTSFELGSGDISIIDDPSDWHVLVGDWL